MVERNYYKELKERIDKKAEEKERERRAEEEAFESLSLVERLNTSNILKGYGLEYDMFEQKINEGLICSYDPETTVRYLKDRLPYRDKDIDQIVRIIRDANDEEGRIIEIDLPIDVDEHVLKKVEHESESVFRVCGYSLATKKIGKPEGAKEDVVCFIYKYEADWLKPIENIVEECPTLYHLSVSPWQEKIKKVGLVPSAKNKVYNYSGRIYLMKQSKYPIAAFKEFAYIWVAKLRNFEEVPDELMIHPVIYRIETKDLPTSIKIYKDPMMHNSYYIKENIPPSCLHFDFNMTKDFMKSNKIKEVEEIKEKMCRRTKDN